MSPELSWRHAKLSSHIFPEEGEVVETYFGGYLLDGEVGGGEAVLDVVDGDAVDDLGGSLAALALADGGEILGCDAEGVGILLHLSLFGALVAEHLGETLEQRLGGGEIVAPNIRLTNLIQTLFEKTGKQVVVLIDEYDAPLLDVAHETEQLDVLRNVIRNFYSPLKGCEPMLRFVFLTGITKFSQLSIFSELNNITNISMNDDYAGICGITKEELLENMSEDIDMLAKANGLSREEAIAKLKEHYDGYHFSGVSPDVFNPYSLLNCFAERKFGAYWL